MNGPTVVADFERQCAMVFAVGRLGVVFPQVLVDVLSELLGLLPVILLVRDEEQRAEILTHMADWGLPGHLVYFVCSGAGLMWVRDYGPQFVRDPQGGLTLIDAEYFRGELPEEDRSPTELAQLLRLPLVRLPLTVEGGNILSDGRGLCLTTKTFIERNQQRGLTLDQLGRTFKQAYGFNWVIALDPLATEPTGHVDMFATFTSPNTVVVGQYDPKIDPINAEVLDANAALLRRLDTVEGPMQVHRVPMPPNHGGVWRTYTNVLYAHGATERLLLVPDYGAIDPAGHQYAMELYRRLLPGWSVRPIRADNLIHGRGVLRCLSCSIPWSERLHESVFTDANPDTVPYSFGA